MRIFHLSRNISYTIFFEFLFSEIFPIARTIQRINHFLPQESDSFSKMIAQDGNRSTLTKQQQKWLS